MSNYPQAVVPLIRAPIAPPGATGLPQANTNTNPTPATQTNRPPQSFSQDYWARYHQFKGFEGAKNALIEDVLTRYDAVVLQCQHLIDQQNAQTARTNASSNQISALAAQQAEYIRYLENLMNSNSFVVAIVDGNNFLFNDAFIRDGELGGRAAAVVFKDELTKWVFKGIEDPPNGFKILIQVFADFKGLAGTLVRGGVIENTSTFDEFVRGFNTLFELVDIGAGNVDSRITDHLKLYSHDYQCRQVIFGGAPELLGADVGQEDMLKERVALLQSVPSDVNTPFKTVSFTDVFRTSKIMTNVPVMTPRTEVFRTSKIMTNLPVMTPRTERPASAVENTTGQLPVARSRNDSLASSVSVATAPGGKTWAARAQEAAPLPQSSAVPRTIPNTASRPVDGPTLRYNAKGQRIDPPFLNDMEALHRVKKLKMCNMHYLHPAGCKLSDGRCYHSHTHPATDAEKEILESVSRETACNNGVYCRDLLCVYGHRCPYPPAEKGSLRGLGCVKGSQCRFPREMHGIKDTSPARASNTGKF